MSELGTIPRKSLVARFDDEHIVKIATSPDDPERLWLTLKDDKMPLSVNGGLDFPKLHINAINETNSAVLLNDVYRPALNGILMGGDQVPALQNKSIDALYQVLRNVPDSIKGKYGVDIADYGSSTEIAGFFMENCYLTNGNYIVIKDPSLDSSVTLIYDN